MDAPPPPPPPPPAPGDLAEFWRQIRQTTLQHGFARSGVATLQRPVSIDLYRAWLEKGYAGEMSYLARHLPSKEDPARTYPRMRSALVVAVDYLPHPEPLSDSPVKAPRVALYARGRDYHRWLKGRLEELAVELRAVFTGHEFLCCTDSAPILERDLATRAGLGWVGKNTCVIDRASGSLFLIGEILTTLPAPAANVTPHDHCGTCTRCLDVCPTGALKAPRELDARLCVSYLTIEARSNPPENLRRLMGDWFFGCDACQTVCPWNVKAFGPKLHDPEASRADLVQDLRWILTASNRALERAFAATPLARAQGVGLKRNALVTAGNLALTELLQEISALQSHPKLGELAERVLRGWPPGDSTSVS